MNNGKGDKMKRLYNCKACYDKDTLISYDTEIIKFNDNVCTLRVYRSMTTYMHIRKFWGRLLEIGEPRKAHIVQELYRAMMTHRNARYIHADLVTNLYVVEK